MRRNLLVTTILAAALSACGSADPDTAADADTATADAGGTQMEQGAQTMRTAVASLRTAEGEAAGTATAMEHGGQVQISLAVQGMPAGPHGVHVHMTGTCEAPTFESAGGHWNPADASHGLEGEAGQHAGDMPNLTVAEDGTGTLEYTLQGGTFAGLLDSDGSAFVVHAGEDDQMTDPSGNSGDRIACGVFEESA